MKPLVTFTLLALSTVLPWQPRAAITIVAPDPDPGFSDVQWISTAHTLDAPKVTPINDTAWDWWYFDAVQPLQANGDQASVVVVFYTATSNGFNLLSLINEGGLTSVDLVQVVATWPNATISQFVFNGTQATIKSVGDGASAEFSGIGASFTGSSDMQRYSVVLNAPDQGLVGSMQLQSRAPAHYSCGAAVAGQDMHVGPHIGWANAVPDAQAQVDLSIRGEKLLFKGVGYHDKNWGDQEFAKSVNFWYWGHSRLGDYSIVWFDFLASPGEHRVSAYVAKDNTILVAQCSGITVRPRGDNSTYPPTLSSGAPDGHQVNIAIPDGILSFTAATRYVVAGVEGNYPYTRWTGPVHGTLNDMDLGTGDALFEQFVFAP